MKRSVLHSEELLYEAAGQPVDLGEDAGRIAHIVSVGGSHAIAVVENSNGTAANDESKDAIVLGSVMALPNSETTVIGIVSGMSTPMPTAHDVIDELTLLELRLCGEIVSNEEKGTLEFGPGVTRYPTIGDPVTWASRSELACIYGQIRASTIEIGNLFQDTSVPARLKLNELLSKHLLVMGNTGTGKSFGIRAVVEALCSEAEHVRTVILDMHDEYAGYFGDKVNALNIEDLTLPFWLLNFQEMSSLLVTNDEHREAEIEILSEALLVSKRRNFGIMRRSLSGNDDSIYVSVDSPTPFRLGDLTDYLNGQLGKLERTQAAFPYRRLKARIEALAANPIYSFMFGQVAVQDNMTSVLANIFRVPMSDKPITTINLSTVPDDILDIVVTVIARLAFNIGLWSGGRVPMLLVCEEAHRYASSVHNSCDPARNALARIAREGRKYGISLALVTQRPSELDTTIISQCGTMITMRLSTEHDKNVIASNTQDGALGFLEFLPMLGERQAIIFGQATQLPMRIQFKKFERDEAARDSAKSSMLNGNPNQLDRQELDEVVSRWRVDGRLRKRNEK